MAPHAKNAVDRLKDRIAERIDADRDRPRGIRYSQSGLAKRLGINRSTLNELINGPSSQRGLLTHLDTIADYFGVPPSLLVHANDTASMELTREEYRVVAHWRTLPPEVRASAMGVLDYLSGLLPEEREERSIWLRWRRLGAPSRLRMEGILSDALAAERNTRLTTRAARDASYHTAERDRPGRTRQGHG